MHLSCGNVYCIDTVFHAFQMINASVLRIGQTDN